MPDANKVIIKKNVKQKTHSQVVNIMKEFMRAITIRKQILDLGISSTVNKLLVSAPVVKKELDEGLIRYLEV